MNGKDCCHFRTQPLASETNMLQMSLVRSFGRRFIPALAVLALVVLASGPASATKYAGAFMENGGGARALAMGGAFTAVADDPSATFWNPAGLSGLRQRSVLVMHSERFGDLINRDFASYVQPVTWSLFGGGQGGLGISVIRLGVEDIPFTDHLADRLDTNGDGVVDDAELRGLLDLQDEIRFKTDEELALLVSYGEEVGSWRVGGSVKVIRQSVGDFSSLGIGADVALLRPRIWRNLDFGVKFQDLTTTYLSWSTGRNEHIAPAIVPGVAWRQAVPDWDMDLVLAGSLETRFENRGDADQYSSGAMSANAHLGLEVGFSHKVYLRTGFDSGWDSADLTAGAGFYLDPLTVDYAYAGDTLDIDEVTHRISVTFAF